MYKRLSAFHFLVVLTLLWGEVQKGGAQIPTGTWQDHPNLTRCQAVAAASDAPIALVAGETALFSIGLDSYGASNGEIQRFGKSDGLSRADIAALALAPEWGRAIVGYAEGTFDLIAVDVDGTLGQVLSVRDLAEADLPGNKRPNALAVSGDRLLVCTDIGVVEYDLAALEVRDTWKLELGGQALAIRDAAFWNGRWWLVTSAGLWSAPSDAPFPGDPNTWEQDADLAALGASNFWNVVVGNDNRLAVLERVDGAADAIWVGEPGTSSWTDVTEGLGEEWTGLHSDGIVLWATTPFGVMETDEDWIPQSIRTALGSFFLQPNGAAAGVNGLWVANAFSGAFFVESGGETAGFEGPLAPNGPRSNASVRMDAWNDRLWVATGGTEASGVPLYRKEGFSGRKGTYWWSIGPPDGEAGGPGVQDPMDVSIDPTRPERVVFGSLEEGLIELEGPEVARFWNPGNSPLDWNANWQTERCAVPTLDFDRQGNLWILNEGTEHPLKMLDQTGEWHVMPVEGFDATTRFNRVLATQSDQVWILMGGGDGIAVISTGGTPIDPADDDVRFLGTQEGEGGLPSPFVYSVEEDLDGEIWVGTLQGPAVFYQPRSLFESDGFDAQQILIEQDGNFQFLLETETVWDIALDGGNRKWVATLNSGVFLLGQDGREQIAHFTSENSPLPSDEVYDVSIDQESGMVYFATPSGITSYRGDATNFRSELQRGGVRVFPNPWRPGDQEGVTIDGLAFGTEVHVMDASGERVRKLESAGGRATWDTRNEAGALVPEGVYFLLCGESSGKSGASGKMVILRQ